MIKILKFDNVYGITHLNGADELGKTNIIYAPNGTAKTSIADAIECISQGGNPDDVYRALGSSSFELDVNGSICNETNKINFEVLKYSGTSIYNLKDEDYTKLVISPTLLSQVNSHLNKIDSLNKQTQAIIESCFTKKALNGKAYPELLQVIAKTELSDFHFYSKLLKNLKFSTTSKLSSTFTEEDMLNFINGKCESLCADPIVQSSSTSYFSAISRPITCPVLDNSFDLAKLNDVADNLITNDYFDENGNRVLKINNEDIDKDKLLTIVKDANDEKYGSEEAKEAFEALSKPFGKSKKIVNVLEKHPEIVGMLNNFNDLICKMFITYIGDTNVGVLSSILANFSVEELALNSLSSSASTDDAKISEIWNKYKSRFKFEKFDLDIANKFNSSIGKELPTFVKYIPGTTEEITDPSILRFSTGELKTFYLINFILEVERLRLNNQEILLILDDAVDSFDYKNKYGFIDYLVDISSDPNVQILLMTHNFDFYRSATLAIGKNNVTNYFAYKNDTGEVNFINTTSNSYLLNACNFNSWKTSPNLTKYVSLIPFYRNVFQLETNSSNPKVTDLDNYLHYDPNTSETIDFSLLQNQLQNANVNIPSTINLSDLYLQKLILNANGICSSSIRETDLDKKLFLGICLRIFTEKFLCKIILQHDSTFNISSIDEYRRTKDLFDLAEPNLTNEEKRKIIEINVISPSYCHANSFMYEPLIDVGADKLSSCYQWLMNQITTHGF